MKISLGLVITFFSYLYKWFRRSGLEKERARMEGYYTAYDFIKEKHGNFSDQLNEKPTGCVKIYLQNSDKLSIGHFSDNGETVWTGEIPLESPFVNFPWKYEKIRGEDYTVGKHRAGLKRIAKNGDRFLLIGEDGFGRELLVPLKDAEVKDCPLCGKKHSSILPQGF